MMSTRGNATGVRPRVTLLVVALVLAVLVPVAHTPAAHADEYGPADTAEYDGRGWRGMGGVWCDVAGYWMTSGELSQVVFDAHCELGSGANGHKVRFVAQAGPCELTGPDVVMPNPGDDGDASGVMAMLGVSTGCGAVTELCFEHASEGFFGDGYKDWTTPTCVEWNLGNPPAPGGESATDAGGCSKTSGPPTSVDSALWRDASTGETKFRYRATVTVTTAVSAVFVTAVWRNPAGTLVGGVSAPLSTGGGNTGPWFGGGAVGTQQVGVDPGRNWTARSAAGEYPAGAFSAWDLVGIQVWMSPSAPGTTAQQSPTAGFLGVTNGANCTWFFGENFAGDLPTSPYIPAGPEGGDPVGSPPDGTSEPPIYDPPGDTDPTPTDDGTCGDFSLTDPSSWAGAAMCAVVRVLIELIGLVEALLSAIGGLVAAILDGLAALFIPDGDAWASLIETLKEAFTGGPMGEWLALFAPPGDPGGGAMMLAVGEGGGELEALSAPTGSCEGPAVDFGDMGLDTAGFPTDPVHPFAACEGTAATVAENVRKWTGIGLALGAGFKILEMLMGSFGAMRQVRIMSGHDWSGRLDGRSM